MYKPPTKADSRHFNLLPRIPSDVRAVLFAGGSAIKLPIEMANPHCQLDRVT